MSGSEKREGLYERRSWCVMEEVEAVVRRLKWGESQREVVTVYE